MDALWPNVGSADINEIPEIMAQSEAKGIYAVPTPQGLTFIGESGKTPESLYQHASDLLRSENVTRPSAYQGGASSLYMPLQWSSKGGNYAPGQGTVTTKDLIPRIESNPDLTKQIELTGEIPQLARGVLVTESGGGAGIGEPLRSLTPDVVLLNEILKSGGLAGLARWVREKGPMGLPAVAGVSLAPTDSRDR